MCVCALKEKRGGGEKKNDAHSQSNTRRVVFLAPLSEQHHDLVFHLLQPIWLQGLRRQQRSRLVRVGFQNLADGVDGLQVGDVGAGGRAPQPTRRGGPVGPPRHRQLVEQRRHVQQRRVEVQRHCQLRSKVCDVSGLKGQVVGRRDAANGEVAANKPVAFPRGAKEPGRGHEVEHGHLLLAVAETASGGAPAAGRGDEADGVQQLGVEGAHDALELGLRLTPTDAAAEIQGLAAKGGSGDVDVVVNGPAGSTELPIGHRAVEGGASGVGAGGRGAAGAAAACAAVVEDAPRLPARGLVGHLDLATEEAQEADKLANTHWDVLR